MRIVSPLLKRVVYPSLGKAGYFRRHSGSFLTVVTYHGVLPEDYPPGDQFLDSSLVSAENFRAQLRLLKSHYEVISCDEFRRSLRDNENLPQRAVLLTCDDGLVNNLTDMLPALREEGLDCLFFVTGASNSEIPAMLWYVELYLILTLATRSPVGFTCHGIELAGVLGDCYSRRSVWLESVKKLSTLNAEARRGWLDEASQAWGLRGDWKLPYLHHPLRRTRFALLTKSEVKHLCDAGMTIGAHSVSHPVLSEQTAESAYAEIVDSRNELLQMGDSVWAFAYPFGDDKSVGARELQLAKKAGFECAFVNTEGILSESSRYALPRFHVSGDIGLQEFEAHITGFHSELRRRFA
ncbi:MAG TPA: polysaccharide deacetylase family protein [Terriglobales bacterium]|nr:polysaccharide deacetylase family protein [Terriglobales bacterium]